jgi:hypothetical protein
VASNQKLQQLIESYREVFQEPQGLPPKREVEHEIQLLLESPLPNIGLYRKSIIEADEVKKKVVVVVGARSHQT